MTEQQRRVRTIYELMAAAVDDIRPVAKKGRNVQQGFNFRGVDDVVNAVDGVLKKYGIVGPVPTETAPVSKEVVTSSGKTAREIHVNVRYRFYGPAGDYIEAMAPGEAMDYGDKGMAKAMSVAYRTVLLQTLRIPTGVPDPDSQTYERAGGRDWIGEADLITDYDDLLALGRECSEAGALIGPVKAHFMRRRTQLSTHERALSN